MWRLRSQSPIAGKKSWGKPVDCARLEKSPFGKRIGLCVAVMTTQLKS
jgi:hypothetical protein